jgi:tRNA 2-thiouridine synthesizing protein A
VSARDDAGGLPEVVLDCLGLACPVPMMETAKRIRELEPGCVLVLLADDPANAADILAWCRLTGHEYLGTQDVGDQFHTRVRKRLLDASPARSDSAGPSASPACGETLLGPRPAGE